MSNYDRAAQFSPFAALTGFDAAIEETRILVDNAEREYLRYKNLYENSAVTKQQYDATKTNYDALKARYEQLKHAKESSSLVKQEHTQRLGQNLAEIKLKEAALELAKLNLYDHHRTL